eukprot:759533-Hanusia_phi.AAC.1
MVTPRVTLGSRRRTDGRPRRIQVTVRPPGPAADSHTVPVTFRPAKFLYPRGFRARPAPGRPELGRPGAPGAGSDHGASSSLYFSYELGGPARAAREHPAPPGHHDPSPAIDDYSHFNCDWPDRCGPVRSIESKTDLPTPNLLFSPHLVMPAV